MSLQSLLEKDKERFLASAAQWSNVQECEKAVVSQLERLAAAYPEEQECVQAVDLASDLIATWKMSASLLVCTGKIRKWTSEETGHAVQKKSFVEIVLTVLGGVCAVGAFVFLGIRELKHIELVSFLIAIAISAGGMFLLFLAGTKGKKAERKVSERYEVQPDGEEVYRVLRNMTMCADRELQECVQREEYKKDQAEREETESSDGRKMTVLFADLLEAGYAEDEEGEVVSRLKYELHKRNIEAVNYTPEHSLWFDSIPSARKGTIRPALVQNGRLLKKGLAAGGR